MCKRLYKCTGRQQVPNYVVDGCDTVNMEQISVTHVYISIYAYMTFCKVGL